APRVVFACGVPPRVAPSFPTRRSSDLWLGRDGAAPGAEPVDRSRRPHHSPGRTAPAMEAKVVALRRQHPCWGGRKLHHRLVALRSEEHTSELQSPYDLVCRLLLEKKKD